MNELSTVRSAGKVIHFKVQVITLDEAPPTAFKEWQFVEKMVREAK